MIFNYEDIYPTEVAEQYGVLTATVLQILNDFRREGLCTVTADYYSFDRKGKPIKMHRYGATTKVAFVDMDEQPRVDLNHPNVIMMQKYM